MMAAAMLSIITIFAMLITPHYADIITLHYAIAPLFSSAATP